MKHYVIRYNVNGNVFYVKILVLVNQPRKYGLSCLKDKYRVLLPAS